MGPVNEGGFRRGDLVEVRSASEILATLDERGALDALPFMPEMLEHLGRRFRVYKRTEKICDTIYYAGSRRLERTVLLDDLRCNGSGHDGCEAECRLYWKEAWLRLASESPPAPADDAQARAALASLVARNTTQAAVGGGNRRYRCQGTELFTASQPLRTRDPRPYLRELSCGNVSVGRFLRVAARALVYELLRKARVLPEIAVRGMGATSAPTAALGLKAGDRVEVKSQQEIAQTLTTAGKNRGLWFDREMLPYCGKRYRVRRRVSRLIDERGGEMIELKSDCVTLEGVVCSGERSLRRWFCPRAIYPYWRECWLRRVDD